MIITVIPFGLHKAPAPREQIRKIRHGEKKRYIELLRLGFSEGAGREITATGLIQAAQFYCRFFFLWKCLSFFRCFSEYIPEIYVYLKDGRMVGVQSVCRRGHCRGPLFLHHVVVDPAYRRRGIASHLFFHLERLLDPEKEPIILAKMRKINIPPIKNYEKKGFHPYAREMTFSLDVRAWPTSADSGKGMRSAPLPSLNNAYKVCIPKWSEITRLKFDETPEEVRCCDPAMLFPYGRPRGLGTFLSNLLFSSPQWKRGIKEKRKLVASAVLAYRRLQETYEIDLSVLAEHEDAVLFLLKEAMSHLAKRRSAPVLAAVRDYQKPIIEALKSFNFSLKDEHIYFCCKIPKNYAG